MSRIIKLPGDGTSKPFGLYIVSGMVKNGSLITSWATGQPATSQIDWGFDSNVENSTPVKSLPPNDPLYDPERDNRIYDVFHEIAFPQTFIDQEHFFRVRSTDRNGQTLVSPVYSVYVSSKIFLASEIGEVSVDLIPINMTHEEAAKIGVGLESKGQLTNDLVSTKDVTIEPASEPIAVNQELISEQKTTFETNVTLTIND
ncbi:hypothetical protein [Rhodohalobacter barkolensis]|uniref:Uncharacterized protein n=1 Tax=Rhodohalobacter barkolensis TaxID=2053187 RepID=A0A2N0VHU0_9BACT|nr:hypothetical protein [Rhodohalobacter barkolensis]PKD43752.1 hypothetical protein CWD77_09340 [Rhodohalobacter barkolensis]